MAIKPDRERLMGTEEATAHGILGMMGREEERYKRLSDLDDEEIGVLTLLNTIGEKLRLDVVKKFVEDFCEFRVSRFRLGRRELGGIIAYGGYGYGEEKRRARSIKELFAGIR